MQGAMGFLVNLTSEGGTVRVLMGLTWELE